MDPLRGPGDARASLGDPGQLAQTVHPGPGGVDDDLRPHRVHPVRQEVAHAHALDAPATAHHLLDLAVVDGPRARATGGEHVLEAEALRREKQIVEVVAGAAQVLGAEARLERQRGHGPEDPVALAVTTRSQAVVEHETDPDLDQAARRVAVDGDEEGQRPHEMRGEATQRLALGE